MQLPKGENFKLGHYPDFGGGKFGLCGKVLILLVLIGPGAALFYDGA